MKKLIVIAAVLASCVALYFVVSTLMKQNGPATSTPLVQNPKALEDLTTTTVPGQILPQTPPAAEQKTIEPIPPVTEMTEMPLEEDAETSVEAPVEEAAASRPSATGNKPVNIPSTKGLNTGAAVPRAANIVPVIFSSGSTNTLPPFKSVTNTTGPVATSDKSQPLPIPPAPALPQLNSDKDAAPSAQPQPNITGPVPLEGHTSQPLPAFTPVTSDNGPVPTGNKEN